MTTDGADSPRPPLPRVLAIALLPASVGVWLVTLFLTGPGASREAGASSEPGRSVRPEAPGGLRPFEPPGGLPAPLPGLLAVTDAVPISAGPEDGGWVILDGRSARWHRVDGAGEVRVSAGGRGDGPGELANPISLALLGDTVLVVERTRGTVERFLLDGTPLDRIRPRVPGCEAGHVRRAVSALGALHILRECLDEETGGSELRVERLEADGGVVTLWTRPWLDLSGGTPFRLGRPLLAGHRERLVVGDALDGCLEVIGRGAGGDRERICHPWPPRIPLPQAEREEVEASRRRLAGLGLRIEIPEHRAPFDEVFLLEGGEVVFRTALGEESRALDQHGGEGGSRRLPEAVPPQTWVGPRSILHAGDLLDGTWILVRPRP